MELNDLSIIYYRHNKYNSYFGISKRRINYYDLTIVLKGQMNYICDDTRLILNAGDIMFCPKGTIQIRPASSNAADYVSYNFISNEEINISKTKHIINGVNNEINLLISLFDECFNNKTENSEEKCKLILRCFILQLKDNIKSQSENPLVNDIKKYLQNNLSKKIKLEDIRKNFYFSPVYCDSLFKKETGMSIIDYLINERIEKAKQLIFEGSYSLSQISELTGFRDYNYFSRVFKKRTGYSPKKYQMMIR